MLFINYDARNSKFACHVREGGSHASSSRHSNYVGIP